LKKNLKNLKDGDKLIDTIKQVQAAPSNSKVGELSIA
jgi:hypothetical protein